MKRHSLLCISLLLCTASGLAQKNELELTLGNTLSSSVTTTPAAGQPFTLASTSNLTYAAGFARQLANLRLGALSFELTVAGFSSHFDNVSTTFQPFNLIGFGSVFVTPGAKFTFLPNQRISPFASAGVGFVRVLSSTNTFGASSVDYGSAFQFGGGVDVKTPVRFLSLRSEVRDFFAQSGLSDALAVNNFVRAPNTHRNHLLLGGGAVFKF